MPRHGILLVTLLVAGALTATTLAGCVAPGGIAERQRDSTVTDLAVTQSSEGGARLSWDEFPRGTAKAFNVYKNGKNVATVDAPTRTWLDTDVVPQVEVTYTVAAVMKDGTESEKAIPVSFTLRQSLTLVQDKDVSRGFVNFTVAEVTPGLKWSGLEVRVAGKTIPRDELAYDNEQESWTHSDFEDDLVDLGETLRVYAPGKVVRHRLVEVALADRGVILDDPILQGRPVLNLTMEQDVRNATAGLVSIKVDGWAWMEAYRDVTDEHPDLVPRWRDLAVYVNGTRVPFNHDGRDGSWWNENPADEVIREGGRLNLRASGLVHAGAVVTVKDDVSSQESFRLVLR